jgi:hypothetical protein
MPTLESRLEKAKKAVEVAKENYEKAKPTEAQFKELGFGHMNERNIEEWVRQNRASKKYREKRAIPAIKALEKLEVAKARLGRAEVSLYNSKLKKKKQKGGKTRRPKRGSNKTLRRV